MIRGWGGGGLGGDGQGCGSKKSKKSFPRKLLIKKNIPTDFGQKKKNMPKENLCRYQKSQPFKKNYEVNDKSRLEIKHDFFNLNMIHE